MFFIHYPTPIYWATTTCQAPCYGLGYIREINGCKSQLIVFNPIRKQIGSQNALSALTSACPEPSHSTVPFPDVDLSSPLLRFLPVSSWSVGKGKNLDGQNQNLLQQVRDRGGLVAILHSKHLIAFCFLICAIHGKFTITQTPDPDYCISCIITPNPHLQLQSMYYLYYCCCLNSYPSFKDEEIGYVQLHFLHCHGASRNWTFLSTTCFPRP